MLNEHISCINQISIGFDCCSYFLFVFTFKRVSNALFQFENVHSNTAVFMCTRAMLKAQVTLKCISECIKIILDTDDIEIANS